MNSNHEFYTNQMNPVPPVLKTNYFKLYQDNSNHASIKFIQECCTKLEVKPSTFAFAATIFHRAVKNFAKADYDKFSISTGAIYLASKANEDPIRLKDIINVSQVTLKREATLNVLGNEAWIISIRDSIVQCELFLMRVLHFDPSVRLPHPFLFNYINTLENWFNEDSIRDIPISKCSLSLLTDFYYNPAIINYEREHVALACVVLTFQIYGLKVPGIEDADTWYKAFCPELSLELLWEIIDQILKVYEYDSI